MSIVNSPYLRTTRDFPQDPVTLRTELTKMYIDIANGVNSRTVGLFPITRPAVTGNTWYLGSSANQTLRQVYPFTSAGTIPHGITLSNILGFAGIYGTFTDGTNWYPLPYTDVLAANNQMNIVVTPTNIVITAGAGTPPVIVSGFVVLEWLSNP